MKKPGKRYTKAMEAKSKVGRKPYPIDKKKVKQFVFLTPSDWDWLAKNMEGETASQKIQTLLDLFKSKESH